MLKAETEDELSSALDRLLEDSELVIAQEWTPTAFDWRIGVLDRRALVGKRAWHRTPPRGHWQIVRNDATRSWRYGRVEAVPLEQVPEPIVATALAAAGLIGSGLYGVDLKALDDGRLVVTEVNDNPNIEAGFEDGAVGDALYDEIVAFFVRALDRRGSRT